jgi:quercetin dioxygenase-like cupin family protein
VKERNMKKRQSRGAMLVWLALASVCLAQAPAHQESHVVVSSNDVKWGPASPKLPPGAEFSRLVGDPFKPGEPYVFRAKLPDGYSVPPHWHPMDENVTVIQGTFLLGFGERIEKTNMRELPAGSYAMLPKEVPHYNVMRGETILQFHGIGPYDIRYVDPTDDPTNRALGR